MPTLSDEQIKAICEEEIEDAAGIEGELSRDRIKAMEAYLGEPMGDEEEGRSSIVTREVLDTVEWMLPQLMRIFTDADNVVSFDPTGEEDEDKAEQETDAINHIFWNQNNGYLSVYSWFKDALLSKTGILKVWWDDSETEEREEYQRLTDAQLGELLFDESVQREVLEYEQTEEGHSIVFKVILPGKISIEACPPEEFGVNADMRTPDVSKARFSFHRSLKTSSELQEMGYPRDLVESLPWSDDSNDTQETLARRHLSDERGLGGTGSDYSLRTVWYTECYVKLDRDDDGIAEMLQVCLASGHDSKDSSSVLLNIEEFDGNPFVTITPVPLTHKFYGLSAADLTIDLQETGTSLTRNLLDNVYFVNNQQRALDDKLVNMDDATESRPGGVVRADTQNGKIPVGNLIQPLISQPLPPEAFNLLEVLDNERKSRTGVGDEVAALDPGALANVNTGVAAIAYDAARAKIELVARNFAELGFRPLFRKMHELVRKNQDRPMMMRMRNQWVEVDPSEWRHRENITINVGMGRASRERKTLALESTLQRQQMLAAAGAVPRLLGPEHMYNALADYTEVLGLPDASRYYQDPETYQPPPPQPDIQQEMLKMQFQVEQGKLELGAQKNQVEMAKAQSAERLAGMQAQMQAEEQRTRQQVEHIKMQIANAKAQSESQNQEVRLQAEFMAKMGERELKQKELLLESQQTANQQRLDEDKAALDAQVKIAIEAMKHTGDEALAKSGNAAEVSQLVAEAVALLRVELEEERTQRRIPKPVTYGADGEIIAIGDQRVTYDVDGQVIQIG